MSTRREMRELLELAGRRAVPARIDADLVVPGHDEQPARSPEPLDELAARRARRRVPVIVTGAAAAVLAILVVAAVATSGDPAVPRGDELALVTAVDTVVVLPDGTTVTGRRGVRLPDGTIIRTGPHGRATVAGTRIGPDSAAVVRDGRVRVLERGGGDGPADPGGASDVPGAVPPDGSPGGTGPDGSGAGGSRSGTGSGGSGGGGVAPTSLPPAPSPTLPAPPGIPPLTLPTLPPLDDVLPLG